MSHYSYPFKIILDFHLDKPYYFAQALDVPEAITQGEDLEDVLLMCQEVLSLCLDSRLDDEEEIPLPSIDEYNILDKCEMIEKQVRYDGQLNIPQPEILQSPFYIEYKKNWNASTATKIKDSINYYNNEKKAETINYIYYEKLIEKLKNKRKIAIMSDNTSSGKDYLADYLVSNKGFKKYAFADELKLQISELLSRPINKSTDRSIMQKYGEMKRREDKLYWIKKLLNSIDGEDNVVISDVRYMNEFKTLLDLEFEFIYITSNEEIRIQKAIERDGDYNLESEQHISQTELKQNMDFIELYTYKIHNNYDEEFIPQILDILELED